MQSTGAPTQWRFSKRIDVRNDDAVGLTSFMIRFESWVDSSHFATCQLFDFTIMGLWSFNVVRFMSVCLSNASSQVSQSLVSHWNLSWVWLSTSCIARQVWSLHVLKIGVVPSKFFRGVGEWDKHQMELRVMTTVNKHSGSLWWSRL